MLETQSETVSGVLIVRPKGRIDSKTARDFEESLLIKLEQDKQPALVDFTGVDYISSAGLRVLLMAGKTCSKIGTKFAMFGMSEHIREVIAISGFLQILTLKDSEEEALAAVQG
ncbi:MAG: STAS domain-containing protein [Rhodospirillales bacterium]